MAAGDGARSTRGIARRTSRSSSRASSQRLIFLTSLFLSVGGGQTTVQDAYDILVNLTAVIYFVPYLYLFPALIRLDRQESARSSDANGGMIAGRWTWGLAMVGFAATAVAVGLAFVPPRGTSNWIELHAEPGGRRPRR